MPDRTEREKMLAGEPYLAADPELVALRARARRLTRLYNATTEEERDRRRELLAELLGTIGASISIEPPFHCDYGANITAGSGLFMNFGCVILDCAAVRIGADVQCGPYVQLLTAYHPTDPAARRAGPELAAPITLGDNVWLGGGVIVCPGVSIGANTTIGAGSIVTRDIPANWEARDPADTTNSSFHVNNSHGLLGGSGPYPAYPLNLISIEAVANTAQLSAADFVTNRQRNAGPSDTPICSQETHPATVAGRAAVELVQHPIEWFNGLIDFPATTYFVPDGAAILILSEVHSPGGQPSDTFTHMLASLTITS